MSAPLLHGFPPVIDDNARTLILGSFPSAQSLAARQYYANPRNAFWPITSELFGFDANSPYESRLAALQSHGVALWDVLHKCRRIGSADSAIDPKSRVINNFTELFANYPTTTQVYFNGAKATELYRRLAGTRDLAEQFHFQRLPSTSPAHVMRPGAKLAAWQAISGVDRERGAAGRSGSAPVRSMS
jgi:hypoxanthine-DNA glycosylase